MRLVLDELYTQAIAAGLRKLGHDVISVHEQADLEALEDEQLFRLAASARRAIVTENWADYDEEMRKAAEDGREHYGVLFTSRRGCPAARGRSVSSSAFSSTSSTAIPRKTPS